MSKIGETFFTSVGCMDGRSECAVAKWGRKEFGVQYADVITEAGLVGLLSKKRIAKSLLGSLKKKILISIEKHHSNCVVVSGHQECAGNPVEDDKHKDNIRKSIRLIQNLINSLVPVVGAFIRRSPRDPNIWEVEEISPIVLV